MKKPEVALRLGCSVGGPAAVAPWRFGEPRRSLGEGGKGPPLRLLFLIAVGGRFVAAPAAAAARRRATAPACRCAAAPAGRAGSTESTGAKPAVLSAAALTLDPLGEVFRQRPILGTLAAQRILNRVV